MLQGRATTAAKVPAEQQGEPAAPTATRRQDKVLAIKQATNVKGVDAPADKPALTLAKSFDSYEATMRLAAMTGMDKELRGFGEADRSAAESSAANDAAPQRPRSANPARSGEGEPGSYTWLWIASAVLVLIAVALFIFR